MYIVVRWRHFSGNSWNINHLLSALSPDDVILFPVASLLSERFISSQTKLAKPSWRLCDPTLAGSVQQWGFALWGGHKCGSVLVLNRRATVWLPSLLHCSIAALTISHTNKAIGQTPTVHCSNESPSLRSCYSMKHVCRDDEVLYVVSSYFVCMACCRGR